MVLTSNFPISTEFINEKGEVIYPDSDGTFGRSKGHFGSYKQSEEDNIAPQVIFEILSPGDTAFEMTQKFAF
jgi:Uma2 family endonuclease